MIARQHLKPGKHVVPKGHRLGRLQVSKPGHDGVGFTFGHRQQCRLHTRNSLAQGIDTVTHIESHICGDLIVTRPTCVELFPYLTDLIDETCFNIHVHVLKSRLPGELAGFDF